MGELVLLIDIGSTYTKAVMADLDAATIIAAARSPTTVDTDVSIGLEKALKLIAQSAGGHRAETLIACSSAAGGLRMVSIGLVPDLSAEAARRAALGAGAKIVGHHSHRLTPGEIEAIVATRPDLLLLAGGTDGGNEATIIHNARAIAHSALSAPIIVAGNKCAYEEIERLFLAAGKSYRLVANVMPEIGKLDVEPCRDAIRDLFIGNIVGAKGLDRAERLVGNVIMATPDALLHAATLLGQGWAGEKGLGELIVVDVGGATTDVYSVATGAPTKASVSLHGLPEPFSKRTVEGDLGVRHNIDTLEEACQRHGIRLDADVVATFRADRSRIARDDREKAVDAELARVAVATSFERHVGRVETVYGPHGEMFVQVGKDLSQVRQIIGTGGPIICGSHPDRILGGIMADGSTAATMKPTAADIYIDENYIMYAAGLLARSEPQAALRLMKKNLKQL